MEKVKVKEEVVPRALAQSVPVPMVVSGRTKSKPKPKNKEIKMSIMRTKMPVAKENVKIIPVDKPKKNLQTVKVSVAKAKALVKKGK